MNEENTKTRYITVTHVFFSPSFDKLPTKKNGLKRASYMAQNGDKNFCYEKTTHTFAENDVNKYVKEHRAWALGNAISLASTDKLYIDSEGKFVTAKTMEPKDYTTRKTTDVYIPGFKPA